MTRHWLCLFNSHHNSFLLQLSNKKPSVHPARVRYRTTRPQMPQSQLQAVVPRAATRMGQPLPMATILSGLKTSPAPTLLTMKRSSLRLPYLPTKPLKGSQSLTKTHPRSKINCKPLMEPLPKKPLSLCHLKKRRIQTLQPRAKSANKRRRVLKRALGPSRQQTQWVDPLLRPPPRT